MALFGHPGVYVSEVPSGQITIDQASTSTAAIIGFARRGAMGKPVFLTRIGDFVSGFGRLRDTTSGIHPDLGAEPDHLGHAVNAFFGNGGTKAYIVRLADGAGRAVTALQNPLDAANTALYLQASSEGVWARGMTATLAFVDDDDDPDVTLGFTLRIGTGLGRDFEPIETFSPVSLDPGDSNYVKAVIERDSLLARGEVAAIASAQGGRSKALKSGPLAGFDPAGLNGATLQVTVDGEAVTVTFDASLTSLAEAAEFIQAATREGAAEGSPRAGFRAYVTNDKRLLLVSGGRADTSEVTVGSGSARAALKLDPAASEADRPVVVSYPAEAEAEFLGGDDGGAPSDAAYTAALATLEEFRDVSIILLPGKAYDEAGKGAVDTAIAHAEKMKNRMVIVDPPRPMRLVTPKSVKDAGLPTSNFAAIYYPWVAVSNPLFDPDTAANLPWTVEVAPSAFAAGVWARIDGRRGVWKAPAGLETELRGLQGPAVVVGDGIQDNLNELGINCLRPIIGPLVIWGARTAASKAKPEDRYIPVRRTALMISESLYRSLQSAVFEPNRHTLWASLRAGISDFMDQLFRAGAFQGEKATDAYFVHCNLGDTMTQADIDAGIVRVVVGFAPLRPAEFVVVEIKKILRAA
jgi:phage tail sheath protein FI